MRRNGRVLAQAIAVLALATAPAGAVLAAEGVQESWDAVYIRGTRVGFFHTQVAPVKDRGRDLVRVQIDMTLSFKRANDPVTIETLYGTIETPDGAVLRLDSRTLASKKEMRTYGDVVDGQMKLILEGAGQRQETVIPWGPDVRGPYGAEMSMTRKPMQPGESREVQVFIPDQNRVGVAKLQAKGPEPVTLGGGVRRDLLRVEQQNYVDGKPVPGMALTSWVDSSGQVLRTMNEVFGGMETYRTTREAALKSFSGPRFDLNAATLVKVRRRINNPTSSREIAYDVALKGDEPAKAFPADARQSVVPSADASRGRLVVKTAGPDAGEPGPPTVDAPYLAGNAFINTGDERVAGLAERATLGLTDPWKKAAAIQHWVFQNVKTKNFETTFAAASEVARDLEGDCTEHSVLTAAMCRAAGIPCRVVVGLLYVEPSQGFGFHMWDEVYVNRRWVAIDSAFDQSEVDAAHLKLVDSSLEGVSPYETFLAVVRVLGKLTIEPVEVR